MKLNIAEQDIIFLSYDEPNCEKKKKKIMLILVSKCPGLKECMV